MLPAWAIPDESIWDSYGRSRFDAVNKRPGLIPTGFRGVHTGGRRPAAGMFERSSSQAVVPDTERLRVELGLELNCVVHTRRWHGPPPAIF